MSEVGIIKFLEISDGAFFENFHITFSDQLNCIIGARGTGKTTTLEAIRLAFLRTGEKYLSPQIDSLLRDNIKTCLIKVSFEYISQPNHLYTLYKYYGEDPYCEMNGKRLDYIPNFPLAIYSTNEIEDIASDIEGYRKRKLIDDFEEDSINEKKRICELIKGELKKNAIEISVLESEIDPIKDDINKIPQVKVKLDELKRETDLITSQEFVDEQKNSNIRHQEIYFTNKSIADISEFIVNIEGLRNALDKSYSITMESKLSSYQNNKVLNLITDLYSTFNTQANSDIGEIINKANITKQRLIEEKTLLTELQKNQQIIYDQLRQKHSIVSSKVKERDQVERLLSSLNSSSSLYEIKTAKLNTLKELRKELLKKLFDTRKDLYFERIKIAEKLSRASIDENGNESILVKIVQNGDKSEFLSALQNALQGSKLRYSVICDKIVETLLPVDLVTLVRNQDVQRLAEFTGIEIQRIKNVIDHLCMKPELLFEMESLCLEDKIEIYLNISETEGKEFKESSKLSTGQKCTAILPILLLSVSNGPILIDQPENNLDNQYIFNDIIPRLKAIKRNRQLIFITHNPNIPVLATAENVIVLETNSQNEIKGIIKKIGNIFVTREEIISILEGGRQAFDLREQIYKKD